MTPVGLAQSELDNGSWYWYTNRPRRRIDWDEPGLTGRSHNEYLRADQNGRVTPHKQEQDQRRDVLGCNRKNKRTIAIEPEKEP